MIEISHNLLTIWEVAVENRDVFDEQNLLDILSAHLGTETAEALRSNNDNIRPCYAYIACDDCNYHTFCLLRKEQLTLRSSVECQQTLKNFVSNFH